MSGRTRLVLIVLLAAAAFAGYRWWNSPERQIQRILDSIAERVTHDEPIAGLAAVAAATALQDHFSRDAGVEPGEPWRGVKGRGEVASAAARLLVATTTLNLAFTDVDISIGDGGTTAAVTCTTRAIFQDRAGQNTLDVRQVTMTLRVEEGRWVIDGATARHVEP